MSEDDGVQVRRRRRRGVKIISKLWVGLQLTQPSLLHRTHRGESPISLLALSILVFSSFNVYNVGFRSLFILNISILYILDTIILDCSK